MDANALAVRRSPPANRRELVGLFWNSHLPCRVQAQPLLSAGDFPDLETVQIVHFGRLVECEGRVRCKEASI